MKFVVTTQFLENYGAHAESGKFRDGNAYQKMKGGTDYIVTGLDRIQDAVAFVAAKVMTNEIGYKEFPTRWMTYEQWFLELPTDEEYREFLVEQAVEVNPNELLKEVA